MNPLNERIRWLVDHFHGKRGVNRAASHIGIAQSTLQRIYAGEREPSLDVLRRIVDAYPDTRLSLDWLVSGRGDEPQLEVDGQVIADAEAASAFLRFHRLLRCVGVDSRTDLVRHAFLVGVRSLPQMLAVKADILVGWPALGDASQRRAVLDHAAAPVTEGWITTLERLVEAYEPQVVGQTLDESTPFILLLDVLFVRWLDRHKHLDTAKLPELYQAFRSERAEAATSETASPPPVRRATKKKRKR